ncbi:AraC family transcriptional regulator [Oceanicella sp. SM1341]|uniref:AraC family transcriptional regulator n=1 Tax=Oceanicella sp. SM1341 TaxID=1548889 RepID=UPI0018E59F2D|nr:AraC family transcriptional regulator [Oceanicella sp. SM1341]
MALMDTQEHLTRRLLEDLAPFVARLPGPAGRATPVPRLTVWASTTPTPPVAAVFEPMFYVVLRGRKVLTMGANRFELRPGTCAASSFGLPYSHQLAGASPGLPYVGVSLHLEAERIARVAQDMPRQEEGQACAVAAAELGGAAGEAFARLVGLVNSPGDIDMLAPLYERELCYRLLQGPMGATLRQLAPGDPRSRRIRAAADWLGSHSSAPVAIADLAAGAGMSVTSFHRHFKAVTGYSPLAFQRQMRLLEARRLLAAGGTSVAAVAYRVGYQSPSQFSREYKGRFGSPPAADLQR